MLQKFTHRNGETLVPYNDGLYWIEGSAIIREKMWPYEHRQRVNFSEKPYEISGGLIDMGNDVSIPVEWVTARSRFWGPVILIPPWKEN